MIQVPTETVWSYPGNPKFALAEDWLDRRVSGAGNRLPDLVLRYLAAFGPASVKDMETWSYLRDLAPAFEKLRSEISLEPLELKLPELWGTEQYRLYYLEALDGAGAVLHGCLKHLVGGSAVKQFEPQSLAAPLGDIHLVWGQRRQKLLEVGRVPIPRRGSESQLNELAARAALHFRQGASPQQAAFVDDSDVVTNLLDLF